MGTIYKLSTRTAAELPTPQTGVVLTQIDWDSVLMEWQVTSPVITNKTILRRTGNFQGYTWENISGELHWSTMEYTLTGITEGENVSVRVCWEDVEAGVFVPSEIFQLSAWRHARPDLPAVTSYGSDYINYSWVNNNPYNEDITKIAVYNYTTKAELQEVDWETTTYEWTGLNPNTIYRFYVGYTIGGEIYYSQPKTQRTAIT